MPGAAVPDPTPEGPTALALAGEEAAALGAPEVAVADAHPTSRAATTPMVAPSVARRTGKAWRPDAGFERAGPGNRVGAVTR